MSDTHGRRARAGAASASTKKKTRLRGRPAAKAKGPTQAECVAHGLMLAAMSGMFKKNGW